MSKIEQMFDFKGKTTKLIGDSRTQAYREVYNHLSEKQSNGELSVHGNYLGDNELAQNIYTKNQIHTFSIDDCKKQILLLKKFKKPIFIGGGINSEIVNNIVNAVRQNGIDISRSLKDKKNNLCENRLNKLLKILPHAA